MHQSIGLTAKETTRHLKKTAIAVRIGTDRAKSVSHEALHRIINSGNRIQDTINEKRDQVTDEDIANIVSLSIPAQDGNRGVPGAVNKAISAVATQRSDDRAVEQSVEFAKDIQRLFESLNIICAPSVAKL